MFVCFPDQMNTTDHGTMRNSPFELVFGGMFPGCCIFPGAPTNVQEEDIADLLVDELQNSVGDRSLESATSGVDNMDRSLHALHETDFVSSGTFDEDNVVCAALSISGNVAEAEFEIVEGSEDEEVGFTIPTLEDFESVIQMGRGAPICTGEEFGVVRSSTPLSVLCANEDEESTQISDSSSDISIEEEPVLATSTKHAIIRQKADTLYRANADKLCTRYGKRKRKTVRTFKVGDCVSVRVPRIDRAGTDSLRLPCVVVEEHAQGLYRLRSCSGVLDNCYRAGDLDGFKGDLTVAVDGWVEAPRVSLREAARVFNNPLPSRLPGVLCSCKGNCTTKRCTCRKAGAACRSSCHGGKPCGNARAACTNDEHDIAAGLSLTDSVVSKCCSILKRDHPEVDGLVSPAILKVPLEVSPAVGDCVQIHHLQSSHWVCSFSSSNDPGQVELFDSMTLPSVLSEDLSSQLLDLYGLRVVNGSVLHVRGIQAQLQSGSTDCALFAMAIAVELLNTSASGRLKEVVRGLEKAPFDQSQMRSHLSSCLRNDKMSPFPRQSCGGSRPVVTRYSLKPRTSI